MSQDPERRITGLFPVPFMMVKRLVPQDLVAQLTARALESHKADNAGTDLLSHTAMVDPEKEALFVDVAALAMPEIRRFGALLFGDDLDWSIKEMWMNVLETGGSQFMHSHANSFASGIIYLSESHPSSRTVFMRGAGGSDFMFRHDPSRPASSHFNAERWVVPEVDPGDMVLYPSYLLHGVPPNEGGRRFSLALNAIPDRLRSFDYEIRFSR
jgi:uncharacterized protein (TIGR02466 family)